MISRFLKTKSRRNLDSSSLTDYFPNSLQSFLPDSLTTGFFEKPALGVETNTGSLFQPIFFFNWLPMNSGVIVNPVYQPNVLGHAVIPSVPIANNSSLMLTGQSVDASLQMTFARPPRRRRFAKKNSDQNPDYDKISTSMPDLELKNFTIGTVNLLEKPYWWLGDVVFFDLNKDGVDEAIVLGSKSHPTTKDDWTQSYLQILGFNTGKLAVETETWFDGLDNKVLAASGGQIFGDFNGDGWKDIWIAPTTDMDLYGPGIVLFNQQGKKFKRVEIDIGRIHMHDVAIADFNKDGYDDLLPIGWGPDYKMIFGRADDTFEVMYHGGPAAYGAGIAAADFLNNGTTTFVITDSERIGNSDTGLYTWGYDNGGFRLDRIATLPADRFYLPKWQGSDFEWTWDYPHSIRALAHDFNRDGLTDVIILTVNNDRKNQDGHAWSEVQFLRNDGQANFSDVTDSVLINFNHGTSLGIAPRLVDINDDGLLDIWLASPDGHKAEDSNRVLLAKTDGTFHDLLGPELAQFRKDVGGEHTVVHYAEDATGKDWIFSFEKYSYSGNNQVNIIGAPLTKYFTADWIA